MGSLARPKKSEARDTRGEILDAALDLFAHHGYFGTSMRQIARAVGVRESALYHHFPSKDAILQDLLGELGPAKAQQLAAVDVPLLVKQLSAEGLLGLLVDRILEEWANPREQKFFRIMLSEGPRLGSAGLFDHRAFIEQARAQVTRLFSELIRVKAIRKVDPAAATVAFMGPLVVLRMMYFGLSGVPADLRAMRREAKAHLQYFIEGIK
jgi:AcrR family transcriptional regulator